MKIRPRGACPVCGFSGFKILLEGGSWPVSGQYYRKVTGPIPMNRMVLETCSQCCFVRKRKFPGNQRNYRRIHRATQSQTPGYLGDIFRTIRKIFQKQSLIVEIGSNNGAFLCKLRAMGYRRVLGIEPSPVLARQSRRSGFSVLCDFFEAGLAKKIMHRWGLVDLVVCRHTLEHIPDPHSFLQAIHQILKPGGLLFLEFPDSRTLFKDLHFYEIWDEHENYFTSLSISEILATSGFRIAKLSSRRYRDALNLCVWAKKSRSGLPRFRRPNRVERSVFATFSSKIKAKTQRLIQIVRAQDTGVAILGAGHPQTNFVLASRIGNWVDCFVDDATGKKGHYVAVPGPRSVISTEQFCKDPQPYLILATAFPYPQWMQSIRKRRRSRGDCWLFPFSNRGATESPLGANRQNK